MSTTLLALDIIVDTIGSWCWKLARPKQMPDQASLLTEYTRHVSSAILRLDGLREESSLLVQCLISEDAVQGVVVIREPGGLQHVVKTLDVIIDKDLRELLVDLSWWWGRPWRYLWRAMVADAKDISNIELLALERLWLRLCKARLPHRRVHWQAVVLGLTRIHSGGSSSSKCRVNGVKCLRIVRGTGGSCGRCVASRRGCI